MKSKIKNATLEHISHIKEKPINEDEVKTKAEKPNLINSVKPEIGSCRLFTLR